MLVPRANTNLGRKAFRYAAPWSWNELKKDLGLPQLITLKEFQSILKDRQMASFGHCTFFFKLSYY